MSVKKFSQKSEKLATELAKLVCERNSIRGFTIKELCERAGVSDGILITYRRSIELFLRKYNQQITEEISYHTKFPFHEAIPIHIESIVTQYYPFFLIALKLQSHVLFSKICTLVNSNSVSPQSVGDFFLAIFSLEQDVSSGTFAKTEIIQGLSSAIVGFLWHS